MKVILRACLLSLGLVLMSGCVAKYKDVSGDSQFSGLIGAKYRTLIALKIHGVSLPKSDRKTINQYVVTKAPGFGGREVIERRDLKVGSTIQVKAVMKCTNCLPPGIEFVIEIFSDEFETKTPIWLYDLSINDNAGNSVMNPQILLRID